MRHPLPDLPRALPPPYPAHRPVLAEVARGLDRAAEADFGIPSFALMEHASLAVAAAAGLLAQGARRVAVLCGPGNNGGDGYGAGRFLASWGLPVRILRCALRPPASGDAGLEHGLAGRGVSIEDAFQRPALVAEVLAETEVAVDALFGVGLTRDLEGPYPGWIRDLNAAACLRLAVDVPSGLDADTGAPRPVAVMADVTVTMALPKRGLVAPGGGADHAGIVIEADIGLPGPLHHRHLRGGS